MPVWGIVLLIIFPIMFTLVGGVIGFFVTRKLIKKELQKNPPINEKMIRAMFLSMGRKPSESQIKSVMRSMKAA